MYAVAIIADILSVIPIVNWITDFVTAAIFAIFSGVMEVNLFSSRNIEATLATIAVEAVFGFVPTWTIRVYFAKRAHRREMMLQEMAAASAL